MTTLNDPRHFPEAPRDPFFYGWRPVRKTGPDGKEHLENMPLTRLDVLHPQEGDVIVQNSAHSLDANYLFGILRDRVQVNPGGLVFFDVQVDLGLPGIAPICPDITVLFGVRDRDAVRGSFDTVAEGTRPSLIIEVVSPSTRVNDFGDKMDYYHQAGVPMYVICDRLCMEGPITLLGHQWTPTGYEEMEPDEQGRLWLDAVGLWLGVGSNRVVCYDGDKEVGDYSELSRSLIASQEARQLAEAQAARERLAREAADEARLAAEAEAAKAKAQLAELLARLASRSNGGPADPPVN